MINNQGYQVKAVLFSAITLFVLKKKGKKKEVATYGVYGGI